jgi:hypothetical protein
MSTAVWKLSYLAYCKLAWFIQEKIHLVNKCVDVTNVSTENQQMACVPCVCIFNNAFHAPQDEKILRLKLHRHFLIELIVRFLWVESFSLAQKELMLQISGIWTNICDSVQQALFFSDYSQAHSCLAMTNRFKVLVSYLKAELWHAVCACEKPYILRAGLAKPKITRDLGELIVQYLPR